MWPGATWAIALGGIIRRVSFNNMYHHHQPNHDLVHTIKAFPGAKGVQMPRETPAVGEDEHPADVDEPPDNNISFDKVPIPLNSASETNKFSSTAFFPTRNPSLLTQALLSSPDDSSTSEADAPALTSDGGFTSPTTPSPHLSASDPLGLGINEPQDLSITEGDANVSIPPVAQVLPKNEDVTALEAGLKQRRCIKFACGRQTAPQAKPEESDHSQEAGKPGEPPKRPSMLKFACPFKPSIEAVRGKQLNLSNPPSPPHRKASRSPQAKASALSPKAGSRQHRDSTSSATTVKDYVPATLRIDGISDRLRSNSAYKRQKLERKEATRFHEFGGSFGVEDEWTREEINDPNKLTVNDTLKKEMAIRKLGQEAEEEAIEEDAEEDEEEVEDDDVDHNIEDSDSEEDFSDGNETDNEEGFADSDDESDGDSDYQFCTPGLTTAASSTDHVEHIRTLTQRVASISSIDSIVDTPGRRQRVGSANRVIRRSSSTKALKMRPGTPDLPDSTDFVCGTLDEDRPLEAAYISCLEERKRSKHKVIPQDIDPSFPTSDPEMDEEDDDEEDEIVKSSSEEHQWIAGRPDDSESEVAPMRKPRLARRGTKSPMPSPKRMRSPAPTAKRSTTHKSPPPRRLFGHSPTGNLLQFRLGQRLKSPPSTRMTSPAASPRQKSSGMALAHLAQRPHLTHTASLPRTPNPFWSKQRTHEQEEMDESLATGKSAEGHSRGPIDIVKGLENKRQRRKEKFWRQHCRNGGKEKERRCQPGKGAERMREVGLEMANKCRGYANNKAQLVLSI